MPTFLFFFFFWSLMFIPVLGFVHYLLCARPPTVYKHFMVFWSSRKIHFAMELSWEEKNPKGQILPSNEYQKHFTEWRLLCYLQNSGIDQCCPVFVFFVLCWLCYFHRLSKPVFFFQSKKKQFLCWKKEKRRRHKCSLSCTHKKWIMSQEGKGSRVPTPRHVMFVFRERG